MTSLHAVTNLADRRPPSAGHADRLPRPLSSFLGREEEIAALTALVTDAEKRLVTVTGPGGIGKTRLAMEVAHRCQEQFRDGAFFAGLADVRSPDLVPGALAVALRVNEALGSSPTERIRHGCQGMDLLLVIDNAEHLLEAAPLLSEIRSWCPRMTLLVTSRETLHLTGEHVFEMTPLPVDLAVDLFGERAGAIVPGFEIGDDSRPDIVEICRHLDGLPLAIELAAARIPVLPPDAMLKRLDNLMGLLSGGLRDAPDRHRGMRETIAWSYDLLTDHGQRLFRAVAVYEGGFTLDAATAMASRDTDVLASLAALEASSLIKLRRDPSGGQRFRMLETVREFAWEQLHLHAEERLARDAHAAFMVDLADDTEWLWWLSGGVDKLDQLEPEMPNIRAALSWLQKSGDVPTVLRLAGSLVPMWACRGYRQEGRYWLEWGLPRSDGTPPETLVVALRAMAWILNTEVSTYRSLLVAQSALRLAKEIDDLRNQVASLLLSAIAGNLMGLHQQSMEWCRAALGHLDKHPFQIWAPVMRCIASNLMGAMHIDDGRLEEAEVWLNQTLKVQESLNIRFIPAGYVFGGLGEITRMRGQPELALSYFLTGLGLACDVREIRQIATFLGSIAGTLAELTHYDIAAKLFGTLERYYEQTSESFVSSNFAYQRALGLPEPWASMYPECNEAEGLRRSQWDRTAHIRSVSLNADQAQAWWNEGRKLDLMEAVGLVSTLEHDRTLPAGELSGLSPREAEVLRLVAQGLPDREIARALFISPRTVQNHVQHIYQKINVSSRSAATRWAMSHGIA